MSSTSDPWREKYRKALLEQEKLEHQLAQQQAAVFQTALSLTQLAEGRDSTLDERLKAIRMCARNEDIAGLERMMGGLSRISKESTERGVECWKKTAGALSNLAKQLAKHSSGDTKGQLKRWGARVGKAPLAPGLMAQQLLDLVEIQAQVITDVTATGQEKPGLLSKLFGKSAPEQAALEEVPCQTDQLPANASVDTVPAAIEPDSSVGTMSEHRVETQVVPEEGALRQSNVESTPAGSTVEQGSESSLFASLEDGVTGSTIGAELPVELPRGSMSGAVYHSTKTDDEAFLVLSPTISRIVSELLAYFEPPVECIEQKIINTRLRIEKGLTWPELIPTLEDVRDLVMQAYLVADNEYRYYLEVLDTELIKICDVLGVAVDCGHQMNTAANTLQETMSHQLQGLNQDLNDNHQVDSLKQSVNDRILHIEAALKQFGESHSSSLLTQLDQLVSQVKKMESDAQQVQKTLELEKQKAITDTLTELPNREAYQERVFHEYSRWQRYHHPLTLAILDIDHFKQVNDTYGHQAGDRVLKVVARSVAKRLREVDFIARFGGEEFVMIFPETNAENTLKALDNIREALACASFTFKEQPVSITASFGIAEFTTGDTIDEVFIRADEALYKAKDSGRNRCLIAGVKNHT